MRELIDGAGRPEEPTADPFYRHLFSPKADSGRRYGAGQAKRELYRRGR